MPLGMSLARHDGTLNHLAITSCSRAHAMQYVCHLSACQNSIPCIVVHRIILLLCQTMSAPLPQVWDFIFLEGPEPSSSKIPRQMLQAMRREFNFWYPFDLRVSSSHMPVQNCKGNCSSVQHIPLHVALYVLQPLHVAWYVLHSAFLISSWSLKCNVP